MVKYVVDCPKNCQQCYVNSAGSILCAVCEPYYGLRPDASACDGLLFKIVNNDNNNVLIIGIIIILILIGNIHRNNDNNRYNNYND